MEHVACAEGSPKCFTLIPMPLTTVWIGRYYYGPIFTGDETEAQKD